MTRPRIIPLALALAIPLRATADVTVPAAPAIAAAPDSGVDPDVAARLASGEDLARRGQLAAALDAVLVLYQSSDPFSQAQRTRAAPRATALLGQIGERARTAGDYVLAARAFDARWTIAGGTDPDLARALLAWSEHAPREQALYLARRARRADPSSPAAADRDDSLSHDRLAWPGRLIVLAGLAALGAGLYADHQGQDALATGLYIAAPVLTTSGIILEIKGVPSFAPMSPGQLPALPER
ncbi:MAG TPA: hypothetical protein VLX92_26850 [Kofleriaceae bacterium]|nr:hypothetical protein [Kofleriaceae bacterium]